MIAVYSPVIPNRPGGVADQTLALAHALERLGHPPVVLAREGDPSAFATIPCVTGIGPLDAPEAAASRGATRLLYQYVPFLYARRGIAPALLRVPGRCRAAGITFELFVHEPYVPLTRVAWIVTGLPQRLQLGALARAADRVFTAVPAFAARIRRWAGARTSVTLAPVGASLPVAAAARRDAVRERLGIGADDIAIGVFSPGASGFLGDWVAQAARGGAIGGRTRWVLFGGGSAHALPQLAVTPGTIVVAQVDARTIAETMRAVDIAAQPYVDGLTLRRTSAMLAVASGIPTVSSTGPLYDPVAGALALCEPTAEAFAASLGRLARDPSARAAAAARTGGYRETASVERLARILLDAGRPA